MTIQSRTASLLNRHPEFFIGSVSNRYPLSIEQIAKYQAVLIWKADGESCNLSDLSNNQNLTWSKEIVDMFIDRWDWHDLSAYIIGQSWWYENLLEDYSSHIDWHGLSLNFSFPWTTQIIEKYSDKLHWQAISANTAIPWSSALIAKYSDRIDFKYLSMSISNLWNDRYSYDRTLMVSQIDSFERLSIIEKHEGQLDWRHLNWDWTYGLDRSSCDEIVSTILEPLLV